MNMKSFLRTNAVPDQRFTRFNDFDAERIDYTVQIQKPNGEIVTFRNPSEAPDGSLVDKQHTSRAGHGCWPQERLFGTGQPGSSTQLGSTSTRMTGTRMV